MKNISTKVTAVFAAMAVLTLGGVAAAQSSGPPPVGDPPVPEAGTTDQVAAPESLSSNCKKTYSSGAGLTRFVWCFSNDGNVVKIEHSAGLEHVRNGGYFEGFCLSSNSVNHGYSLGDGGNVGLNAPTYPSASKVTHTTTDGVWKIEQSFAQTTGQKLITITMKITNTSAVVQNNVYLTRGIDADVSGNFSEQPVHRRCTFGEAAHPGSARLELLPTSTAFVTNNMIYAGAVPVFNQFQCYDATADGTNSATGDLSMGVLYQLGSVLPGGSKTAKFVYQATI